MPQGLVLLHWDTRFGGEPRLNFPENLSIDNKEIMQIYSQHEFSGKTGLIQITTSKVNLLSYYLGKSSMNYLVLYLKPDENVEDFEDVLKLVSFHFISDKEENDLGEEFKEVYQIIENYPNYTYEQKLALFLYNPLYMTLFRIFQEEMVLPLSELEIMIRERLPDHLEQLPGAIEMLTQAGFLNTSGVKGVATDLIFQIDDILIHRLPPGKYYSKLIELGVDPSYIEKLKREAKAIFSFYKAPDSDNLKIIRKVVLNSKMYQVYNEFRSGFIPDDDFEKIEKKLNIENLQPYIDTLINLELVMIVRKPESRDYFIGLRSDLIIERVYPEYHIDLLTDSYRNQKHHPDVVLKGLELLKETYLAKHQKKKKIKAKFK